MNNWDTIARRIVTRRAGSWFIKNIRGYKYELRFDLTLADHEEIRTLQALSGGVGRIYTLPYNRLTWRVSAQPASKALAHAMLPYLSPAQQLVLATHLDKAVAKPDRRRFYGPHEPFAASLRQARRASRRRGRRGRRGFTEQEMRQWLRGETLPTLAQTRHLAVYYNRPSLLGLWVLHNSLTWTSPQWHARWRQMRTVSSMLLDRDTGWPWTPKSYELWRNSSPGRFSKYGGPAIRRSGEDDES